MNLQSFQFSPNLFKKSEKITDPLEVGIKNLREELEIICKDRMILASMPVVIMSRYVDFTKHIPPHILSKEKSEEIKDTLYTFVIKEIFNDEQKFIDGVVKILMPILQIVKTYPKEYEEAQAKAINERHGYTELNRLVSYEKDGSVIKLHHSPGKTLNALRFYSLYKEAMKKLSKIVIDDETIEKIEAASWIVTKNPDVFIKNGFSVKKVEPGAPNSRDTSLAHEKDPERQEISIASISRADFLKTFSDNLN